MLDLSAHPRTVIRQAETYKLSPVQQMELAMVYFNTPLTCERKKTKDRLILGGLFFVATVAYKVADSRGARGWGYFPDLVNTGASQLIEEFDRYDVHGHDGTPFVGFAEKGVRGALLDYRRINIDSVVRLPEGFDYKDYNEDVYMEMNHLAPRARSFYPTPHSVTPEQWASQHQMLREASQAFFGLSLRQQNIVEHVLEGEKQPKIAKNLGVSEQTVQRDRDVAKKALGNFML